MLSNEERRDIEDSILKGLWDRIQSRERQAAAAAAKREARRLRRQRPPDLAVWIVQALARWAAWRVSRRPARARAWQWQLLEELCLRMPDEQLGLYMAGVLRMCRHITTGKWHDPPRQRPSMTGDGGTTPQRGPGGSDLV